MDTQRLLIASGLAVTLLIGGMAIMMLEDGESLTSDGPTSMIDPLIQYDEGMITETRVNTSSIQTISNLFHSTH